MYRECNRCANALARWGNTMNEDFVVFDSPPSPEILCFVNMDIAGMYIDRITESGLTTSVG